MLYFTRWKAMAVILTALLVCLCAVPNFFPEAQVKSWPKWAQRHVVLGLDLQGGSHILLEVDSSAVRKHPAASLQASEAERSHRVSTKERTARFNQRFILPLSSNDERE